MTDQNQSLTSEVTQSVQLAPVDFGGIQVPSSQNHLVNRKYKGVLCEVQFSFDGKASLFKSGELATLLKDEFARKGGVNLTKVEIIIRGNTIDKQIAFAFHQPSEEIKTMEDVNFAMNSVSLYTNSATKHNRFQANFTFPTALGMQIVPPDPVYLALHFSMAVDEGFTGTCQIYFTYDCDIIYNKKKGF